jgi:hypothetical protein
MSHVKYTEENHEEVVQTGLCSGIERSCRSPLDSTLLRAKLSTRLFAPDSTYQSGSPVPCALCPVRVPVPIAAGRRV